MPSRIVVPILNTTDERIAQALSSWGVPGIPFQATENIFDTESFVKDPYDSTVYATVGREKSAVPDQAALLRIRNANAAPLIIIPSCQLDLIPSRLFNEQDFLATTKSMT